ncbi:ABC transporter permease [Mesorhizobium sp. SB112]|uniref:ABC transporter permease n=1 Tax=Mesorhizobium sp. SB112 TaxID=3151853 RepID=UPI003263741F
MSSTTASKKPTRFSPPTYTLEYTVSLVFFLVVIGVWEWSVQFFGVSPLVFPTPSATLSSLWRTIADGTMTYHFLVTAFETLAGFFVGAILGLLLGGIIGQSAFIERVFYPYVIAFQTIPKVAIAPLFVIWFGFGMTSKVVITATIVFFPVLANTIVGLRSAPQEQHDLLTAFDGSRWQVFKYIKIPNALPYVFVGFDVGIVLAIIGAIVGEFVGSQAGLGYLILQRNFSMDTAGVFAILIVLSLMGIGLHGIMQFIKRRVVFWVNHDADQVSGA